MKAVIEAPTNETWRAWAEKYRDLVNARNTTDCNTTFAKLSSRMIGMQDAIAIVCNLDPGAVENQLIDVLDIIEWEANQ